MFIQTESTPNPQTLKFIPGMVVMPEGVAEFRTREEAVTQSPFAARLLDIRGVRAVFFGADFISITKDQDCDWADIKTFILGVLFEQFSLNKPVIYPIANGDKDIGQDSHIIQKIKAILDERVRPAVARDGGDIVFHSFERGVVFLKMRGACAGCPSSTMTLKSGIENMLRHFIPEVLEVRAVPD
jgi:Fe-S cluster biogenesis protein NfuA